MIERECMRQRWRKRGRGERPKKYQCFILFFFLFSYFTFFVMQERVRELDVLYSFLVISFLYIFVNLLKTLDGLLLKPAFNFNKVKKIYSSSAMVQRRNKLRSSVNMAQSL